VGGAHEDSAAVLITLDADSVSVNTVLQILAERSGLNIVTGPEVRGQKISLHLRNTPFEEALDLTVRAAGFGYQRVGGSILVGSPDRLEKETGIATHVVTLQYADAVEVKKMLETLTKSVEIDIQGNRLIATGTPSIVEEIKRIIIEVDVPPQTVLIQSRVIEVSTSALEELGVQWDKITKWTGVITEGDQGPSFNDLIPREIGTTKFDETTDWYRQQEAFQVSIDLLITDGSARVIAESKIVTTNNRKADIFIGEDIPVVITSLTTAGGFGTQQIQLEHIKVGVSLAVTPRISDDDYITMFVEPKVSNILEFIGPDNDLPRTSERRATTYVRSENGKTIFVGGLQAEDTKQTIMKVPLLGDIPVIGNLFRHYRNESQKKDLLIEITPTIVR
jgi:type IV pilus secretin PilQ/predicted competence protein